jgi:phage tail-like protein
MQMTREVATPALNNESSERLESSYLQYLPALYRDDELMGQFLLIFEDTMKSIENTINNMALYFDPLLTSESLLPWLASWVNLVLNPAWPVERRRDLVQSAASLYRLRGTKRGLSEYLRICTGSAPEISEYIPGMTLDDDNILGVNTRLGSSGTGHHFTVSVELDGKNGIDIDTVRSIIDSQKPAHAVYTLQVRQHG